MSQTSLLVERGAGHRNRSQSDVLLAHDDAGVAVAVAVPVLEVTLAPGLAATLRARRMAAGLTLRALKRDLCMSQMTIYRLESGGSSIECGTLIRYERAILAAEAARGVRRPAAPADPVEAAVAEQLRRDQVEPRPCMGPAVSSPLQRQVRMAKAAIEIEPEVPAPVPAPTPVPPRQIRPCADAVPDPEADAIEDAREEAREREREARARAIERAAQGRLAERRERPQTRRERQPAKRYLGPTRADYRATRGLLA